MTQKLTIAIDVDEVLADYSAEFVLMSNKLWGTTFTKEDYHEDWLKLWGVDLQEAMDRGAVMLQDRMHERLKHDPEAVKVLNHLAKTYHLIILTARNTATKALTLKWIRKHYPMIDTKNIIFAGIWDNPEADAVHKTKGAMAKELGVDYLIDDQLKHCFAASEHGIEALLFGDYTWNAHVQLPKGVTRVVNWGAVKEYFDERAIS